jgi:thiamine biosynthesis lipoprotein
MQFFDSFRAMNTDVDVIVEATWPPSDAFVNARLLFERQEERFSRFRTSSLLSRLNAGEAIDDELFARACRMALDAHEFTGGLFNPMVLAALAQAGYSTTFDQVSGGDPVAQRVPNPREALTLAGNVVRLREGALDLGGIVKGWTVDIGLEALSERHPNLFLNAGGDLRCTGAEEGIDGWLVSVAGRDNEEAPWEGPMRGALATSTTRKRRWTTASGGKAHHLIDPRTGLPAESPFEQVSVWHAETWVAECWAKAVLIGGEAAAEAAAGKVEQVLTIDAAGAARWW